MNLNLKETNTTIKAGDIVITDADTYIAIENTFKQPHKKRLVSLKTFEIYGVTKDCKTFEGVVSDALVEKLVRVIPSSNIEIKEID